MAKRWLYSPLLFKKPIPATELGATFAPSLFLEVDETLLALMFGMLEYLDDERYYSGTPEEVEVALQVIRGMLGARVMTQAQICGSGVQWGANFRFNGNLIEAQQGEGLPPPPWDIRTTELEDGGKLIEYKSIEE